MGSNLPMYHQNYQNMYNPVPPNAYAYANSSGASVESVPSSWEASYPAAGPSQGYVSYASGAMPGNNSGYYDPYAAQQYSNQYSNSSVPTPMMMGQMGYANYGGYGDGG